MSNVTRLPVKHSRPAAKSGRAANDRVSLTEARIAALPATGQRYDVRDAEEPALRIRVTEAGSKSYCVLMRSRITGKLERITLPGGVAGTNLKQARKWAQATAAKMNGGIEVAAELRALRAQEEAQGKTVAEMFAEYADKKTWAGKKLTQVTVDKYARELQLLLGDRFDKPMARLTPELVADLHLARIAPSEQLDTLGRIQKRGSQSGGDLAVHALAAICKRFDLPNLGRLVYKQGQTAGKLKRAARLPTKEAPALAAWLVDHAKEYAHHMYGTQAEMFLLAMLTGFRQRTVRELEWHMIEFDREQVKLPAAIMKNRKAYTLPLGKRALQLLRARKDRVPAGRYVFAMQRDPNRPANVLSNWMGDVMPAACSIHDARKVFATALAKVPGVSWPQMVTLMTHSPRSEETLEYVALEVDDLRPPLAAVEALFFPSARKAKQ
jgi:integrase